MLATLKKRPGGRVKLTLLRERSDVCTCTDEIVQLFLEFLEVGHDPARKEVWLKPPYVTDTATLQPLQNLTRWVKYSEAESTCRTEKRS